MHEDVMTRVRNYISDVCLTWPDDIISKFPISRYSLLSQLNQEADHYIVWKYPERNIWISDKDSIQAISPQYWESAFAARWSIALSHYSAAMHYGLTLRGSSEFHGTIPRGRAGGLRHVGIGFPVDGYPDSYRVKIHESQVPFDNSDHFSLINRLSRPVHVTTLERTIVDLANGPDTELFEEAMNRLPVGDIDPDRFQRVAQSLRAPMKFCVEVESRIRLSQARTV